MLECLTGFYRPPESNLSLELIALITCISSDTPLFQAMKRGLDCDNLECLQDEPASEIIRVQESIMGVPRSVGDFFT